MKKENSIDEKEDVPVLTFKAVSEKLDWRGNVVKTTKTYKYRLTKYNPEMFLESVIRDGDLNSLDLFGGHKYAYEFMCALDSSFRRKYYNSRMETFVLIESDSFQGMKFVVYDRMDGNVMKWRSSEIAESA